MTQQLQNSDTVKDTASSMSSGATNDEPSLTIHLRDISTGMVKAWREAFKDEKYSKCIKASIYFPTNVMYYAYYCTCTDQSGRYI